jgi:hypothetical protein
MQMLNAHRMPPLATSVVDVDGAALLEGWVGSYGKASDFPPALGGA